MQDVPLAPPLNVHATDIISSAIQRGAVWCQLSMGRQSAVSIFIFSCPALCLINPEWLQSFPLGSFPSPPSLCDLIRRMIHTLRSLGFHRKHGHMVRCTPTTPGERPHIRRRHKRVLWCAFSVLTVHFLALVMDVDITEAPEGLIRSSLGTVFITILICFHGFCRNVILWHYWCD